MTQIKSRNLSNSKRASRIQQSSVEPQLASLRLHLTCIFPVMVAAIIFTLTEHDDHQHSWWCAFEILLQFMLVAVGTVYFRTRFRIFPDSSLLMPPLIMVAGFSLLCEPVQRIFFDKGHSFEVLIMHSQCNLMLGLAVCGFRISMQRLAMLIAVFLTIFSCTISDASGLILLTALFALATLVWLVASWWETVDCRLADTKTSRSPLFWTGIAICVPLLVLAPSLGWTANGMTRAMQGFMPSSGGTKQFDPYSRGGVNDGDALVAGSENIKSFAPIEDAPFLDSDRPSLYDVFNDQFDDAVKKIKNQQRAIPLPADLFKHIHQQMAEAKSAGREFSLIRSQKTKDRNRISDLNSPAAFYVAGQVPARFRMEVYDLFDGTTWYPTKANTQKQKLRDSQLNLKTIEGRDWLRVKVDGRAFEMHSGSMTHSLKIANLDGNIIPSPPQLCGVNIEYVNRADFYSISAEKIASLKRDSVPTMTPINVVSEYVDRDRLFAGLPKIRPSIVTAATTVLPEEEATDTLHKIARQWTEGIPEGWQTIAEIERRLRENYVVDRDARVSSTSANPVNDFLTSTRKGPEYLFASSAACLLRSLGYPTRLVSGFYAKPENYDSRKKHTAVLPQDAHFWCEVDIGLDSWVTLEPSPGYAINEPPAGFFKRMTRMLASGLVAAQNHAVELSVGFLLICLLVVSRRFLTDAFWTLRWKMTTGQSEQQRSIHLARLVEQRMKLARLQRHSSTTLRRWARQSIFEPVRNELTNVANIADASAFGQANSSPAGHDEFHRLATLLSYRRLKQLKRQTHAFEPAR